MQVNRRFAIDDEERGLSAEELERFRSWYGKQSDDDAEVPTTTMDAQTQARWDKWANALINRRIKQAFEVYFGVLFERLNEDDEKVKEDLRQSFDSLANGLRKEWRKEIREAIADEVAKEIAKEKSKRRLIIP